MNPLMATALSLCLLLATGLQDLDKVLGQARAALGDENGVRNLRSLSAVGDLRKEGARLTGDVHINFRAPGDICWIGELDPDAGGRRSWIVTPGIAKESRYDADENAGTGDLDPFLAAALTHIIPSALPLFSPPAGGRSEADRLDILGSRTFYPVVLSYDDGRSEHYAVDAATGVILRVEIRKGEELEAAIDLKEFKLLDGVRLPYEIEIANAGGRVYQLRIRYWKLNPELAPSLFTPGAPLPPMRK